MRLIDAHRRIEVLEKDKDIEVAVNQYMSVQPTAYDVDKVIEDLEYERKDVPDDKDYWSWVSAIDKAIEIVKQGGVTDDVCEWRIVDLPNNFQTYNTSCGKIRLQYSTGVDIYCNGCGKKIKIVGD